MCYVHGACVDDYECMMDDRENAVPYGTCVQMDESAGRRDAICTRGTSRDL